MTEKRLTLAYKLIKCRDSCRKFYGEEWPARQAKWKPIIEAVMVEKNCELLNVAIILGKQLDGFTLMACLGTIMEMMEKEEDK